jgi:sulfane dehydrogenase subunit SoxC
MVFPGRRLQEKYTMSSKQSDRRRFLTEGAALVGSLAVGSTPVRSQDAAAGAAKAEQELTYAGEVPVEADWEAYGVPSRFGKSARIAWRLLPLRVPTVAHQTSLYSPLQNQMGIITPSGLHYAANHSGTPYPDIDPETHRLLIHGMVERPLILTVEDVKRLPSVSRIHFIECNANTRPTGFGRGGKNWNTVQHTHGWASCSEWTGVRLSALLQQAGVKKGAGWVISEGVDEMKLVDSIPLSKAMDDALVVYGQNGEPLRREQGFPLRLLTPGFAGIHNVKYLRRLEVVDQPQLSHFEIPMHAERRPAEGRPAGWVAHRFQWGPKSVIIRPSAGLTLPGVGFYEITGLAWSGAGAVRRVEVSTNNGRSWKAARLQPPVLPKAFTRFCSNWNWDGAEAVLLSRCIDELGQTQPTLTEFARAVLGPSAPAGYPVDIKGGEFSMCNAVQPWRVLRDGSVHNAMFT